MTITRILPGAVLVAITTAGPAAGQFRMPAYSPPGRSPGVMSSGSQAGASDPEAPPPRPAPTTRLEQMTTPLPPGGVDARRVETLTAPPGPVGLPPGAYASPWFGDAAGCCGPVGAHGPVAYEIYARTGPNIPFGSGRFTDHLNVGWGVGGGGRSLFFNTVGDAAWVVDLGLSYTYNRGKNDDFLDLFIRQAPTQQTNPVTGRTTTTPQPDRFVTTRIRGLHRTSFNFAVGRDWFVWGSGLPGGEEGWNLRVGTDVGGRWGTAHVDIVPIDDGPGAYARRQSVFHGLFLGFHSSVEVPVGGWVWFAGSRAEWGYDWMNIVPPIKGDVQNVNLLLSTGVRF